MSDDPFHFPPLPPKTLEQVMQDNLPDIYDRDIGVKQAPLHVLEEVLKAFRTEDDRQEFVFNAMSINGDALEAVDYLMEMVDKYPEEKFSKYLHELLIDRAQDVLEFAEDFLANEYKLSQMSVTFNAQPISHLKDYRDKKGE